MTAGRIKYGVLLAGLILGGGLLCVAGRIKAASGQEQTASAEPQKNDTNSLTLPNGADLPRAEGEFFYKMLLSVVVVIALGSAVIYISKKVLPRFTNLPGKQIRVIETTHIAPRKGLHLVQVGVRRLLIASTNEQITMLADVTDSAGDFASQLEARCKDK
ncbi:MAG: flagellar biosynthetic protein FliO [Sedimentisphaerales bacterium]